MNNSTATTSTFKKSRKKKKNKKKMKKSLDYLHKEAMNFLNDFIKEYLNKQLDINAKHHQKHFSSAEHYPVKIPHGERNPRGIFILPEIPSIYEYEGKPENQMIEKKKLVIQYLEFLLKNYISRVVNSVNLAYYSFDIDKIPDNYLFKLPEVPKMSEILSRKKIERNAPWESPLLKQLRIFHDNTVKETQKTGIGKMIFDEVYHPFRGIPTCLIQDITIKIKLSSLEQMKQSMKDSIFYNGTIPENIAQVKNVKMVQQGKELTKNELKKYKLRFEAGEYREMLFLKKNVLYIYLREDHIFPFLKKLSREEMIETYPSIKRGSIYDEVWHLFNQMKHKTIAIPRSHIYTESHYQGKIIYPANTIVFYRAGKKRGCFPREDNFFLESSKKQRSDFPNIHIENLRNYENYVIFPKGSVFYHTSDDPESIRKDRNCVFCTIGNLWLWRRFRYEITLTRNVKVILGDIDTRMFPQIVEMYDLEDKKNALKFNDIIDNQLDIKYDGFLGSVEGGTSIEICLRKGKQLFTYKRNDDVNASNCINSIKEQINTIELHLNKKNLNIVQSYLKSLRGRRWCRTMMEEKFCPITFNLLYLLSNKLHINIPQSVVVSTSTTTINMTGKPKIYEGYYFDEEIEEFSEEYELKYVKIKDIKFSKDDNFKYKNNLELISKSGSVVPVRIGDFENGLYILAEGNHRCYCCQELGYTYIPAYVWLEEYR